MGFQDEMYCCMIVKLSEFVERKNMVLISIVFVYVMYKVFYVFFVFGGWKVEYFKSNIEVFSIELIVEEI